MEKQGAPTIASAEHTEGDDLRAAMRDLDDALTEAAEEGFPRPSPIALENARGLLPELYDVRQCRIEVYPTPDGEVALDFPGGFGQSVIVLCDSDGGALCSVSLGDHYRSKEYPSAETLPDSFVRKALGALGEEKRA